MKELPPVEYLHECLRYDPESGALIWRERPQTHFPNLHRMRWWNSRFADELAGSPHVDGYIQLKVGGGTYLAHRIIWKLMTDEDPYNELDHKDRNRANNKWDNLRRATTHQNTMNRTQWQSKSGIKGAYERVNGRWQSGISIYGEWKSLGTFDTAEEAHAAWRAAAAAHHGEFFNPGS